MHTTSPDRAAAAPSHQHQIAPHNIPRGVACAAVAGACWGSMLLVPALLPDFNPLAITSARFMLYGLMSLFILAPMARRLPARDASLPRSEGADATMASSGS